MILDEQNCEVCRDYTFMQRIIDWSDIKILTPPCELTDELIYTRLCDRHVRQMVALVKLRRGIKIKIKPIEEEV